MPDDVLIQNLLLLYGVAVLLNIIVFGALYTRERVPIYGAMLLAWTSVLVAFVGQGALSRGDVPIILGFATVVLPNFAFAYVLGSTSDLRPRWRGYAITIGAAIAVSIVLDRVGAGFTVAALPVAIAVALPCLVTVVRVMHASKRRSTATMVLVCGCVLFSLHNIDFAFLRMRESLAPFGFTVATLIVFMLAIAGSAVALEQATERQVRLSTELDVARRIQAHIMPKDQRLPGLEMACHVRSAESVGGDYLDVYREGECSWFLLGDVTGHGLGAGLVMLMAQSTMSTLLHARPEISPRELNFLANRVLAGNLARMAERRHLTAISMVRKPGNRFIVSGSHDGLLVYRAASSEVALRAVDHFPVGLGFLGELAADDFREEPLELRTGDVLLLFTDGITEAARGGDARAELFGTQRLADLLRAHARAPLGQLKHALLDELDGFTGGVYQDDVAFLMIRVNEEGA